MPWNMHTVPCTSKVTGKVLSLQTDIKNSNNMPRIIQSGEQETLWLNSKMLEAPLSICKSKFTPIKGSGTPFPEKGTKSLLIQNYLPGSPGELVPLSDSWLAGLSQKWAWPSNPNRQPPHQSQL